MFIRRQRYAIDQLNAETLRSGDMLLDGDTEYCNFHENMGGS